MNTLYFLFCNVHTIKYKNTLNYRYTFHNNVVFPCKGLDPKKATRGLFKIRVGGMISIVHVGGCGAMLYKENFDFVHKKNGNVVQSGSCYCYNSSLTIYIYIYDTKYK